MTAPGNPFEHLHIGLKYKRRMAVILQKPTSFYCHLRERERERDGEEGREIIQPTAAAVTNVEHANEQINVT